MAYRRCLQGLKRQAHDATAFLFTNPSSLHSPSLPSFPNATISSPIFTRPTSAFAQWSPLRYFSSSKHDDHGSKGEISEDEEEEDDSDDYEEEGEGEGEVDYDDGEFVHGSKGKKVLTPEEKEAESAAIGYKVVGPLVEKDGVFKPYEPVFAVVQIGSHQFKVSNGDSIFTERLKFCEVNDKLILNKVLLVGSAAQTIIGRPTLPDAAVHAVVEEHALDAKVIIFKKKRRKNYRRTRGHRQELTKLRITDIQGIEKPPIVLAEKPSKAPKEQEKVAVPA